MVVANLVEDDAMLIAVTTTVMKTTRTTQEACLVNATVASAQAELRTARKLHHDDAKAFPSSTLRTGGLWMAVCTS